MESFSFYEDSARVLVGLPAEDAGKVVQAIIKERLDGEAPAFDPLLNAVYLLIKGQVDRAEEIRTSRSESGKRGGRKPRQAEATDGEGKPNESKPKQTKPNLSKGEPNATTVTYTVTEPETVTIPKPGETVCAETSAAADAPRRNTVITLTLNDKSEYPIYEEQTQEWAALYPAVDVIQQLRNMAGWLMANPAQRKTKTGILRFVNGWLAREQDKGSGASRPPAGKTVSAQRITQREYDERELNALAYDLTGTEGE